MALEISTFQLTAGPVQLVAEPSLASSVTWKAVYGVMLKESILN